MRLSRAEILDPSEIVAVHTLARTNRRCFLLGDDLLTGNNFDHRKQWIEDKLQQLAAYFEVDLLAFSCLSNHFHLVLRSRPEASSTLLLNLTNARTMSKYEALFVANLF